MAIKEITYQGKTFPLSYDILNPRAEKNFVILHGWGSNKEIMKRAFSTILSDFRHIYIDMPGFGKSHTLEILTTQDYKNIITLFLEAINKKADIIAGHSFGGKVAVLMEPEFLVLLSSAGIPVPKSWKIRMKIKFFKLFKLLGLGKFRTLFVSKDVSGMSQNMYETFKNVVDEDFSPVFETYKGPALLFWGKEDTATPLWTAETIQKLIPGSKLFPLDGDHYFFTRHSRTIGDIITKEYHG